MANKEIKQTIRLTGEKEYSQALRDAQRNLKTLRSELKAETAELGGNATAQQKNEARARSLQRQIAEQEKVVETLRKALAEAKKDYGDNEDVVQKWEQKLNDARATLAGMQSGLAEAENAMRGTSSATAEGVTATKSFADALNQVASVGESVSGAIEGIFTGLIGSVRDVVVDLWELIGDTAAKANNWTDIAGYWNTDPENVEKWARAVEASGNSFSDFEAVVSRLSLGGKGKEITEMLGISDANYASQWDYAVACMEQISRMTKDGSLPENFWETVFGERKATKAMDLINDWETVQQGLTTFDADNGGFGMGRDEMATMNDLYVQITTIEQKWQALKDSVAGGLGTIAADLLVNVSGSLDAINDYFNAETDEERQLAIDKLTANVEEMFAKVAEAIRLGLSVLSQVGEDLQNSDDPVVSAIGSILTGITDALEWLVNHQDAVVKALEAIFGTWLIGKLTMVAGKLASIIAQIETIKAFKGLELAGGAAGAGGAANAAGAAAGGASGGGLLAGLGSSAAAVLVPLAGGTLLSGAIWGPLMNHLEDKHYHEQWDEYNAKEDANAERQAAATASGNAEAEHMQALLDELLWAVSGDEQLEHGEDMTEAIKEAFRSNANEYLELAPESEFWEWAQQFADLGDGLDAEEIEQIINGVYLGDAWQQFGIDAANAAADRVDQLLGGGAGQPQPTLTGEDVSAFKGLPAAMRQALFDRISGLQVTLNGEVVGRILTPYVSAAIARDATQ